MNRKKIFLTVLFLVASISQLVSSDTENSVILRGAYLPPESLENPETIIWECEYKGEYLEVIVTGKILNLQLVNLSFEENDLVEKSQLFLLDKVEDKTIVLLTSLPSGMPYEKLKWTDMSGKEFEYLISNGSGMEPGPPSSKFNIK